MKRTLIERLEVKSAEVEEAPEQTWFERQPTLLLPALGIDQLQTTELPAIYVDRRPANRISPASEDEPFQRAEPFYDESFDQLVTWILPVVKPKTPAKPLPQTQEAVQPNAGSPLGILRNLAKSSGIYAVAAMISPFISLVLSPFLTHTLSVVDYGILAILTSLMSLGAGLSQLGMGQAFFRAYNLDYSSASDRGGVVGTALILLAATSLLLTAGVALGAPWLAGLLIGHQSLGGLVILAALVVSCQNMTVPGFAWLRAVNRPLFFSLLSLASLLVNLVAVFVLVGGLHAGVAGALIATGSGYLFVVLCTLPMIFKRFGLHLRVDMARSMLAFGSPLIFNFIAYWILQLSDRYLLGLFGSLAQTASYSVAYTLGGVLSTMVISPFTLAWPTAMFTVAKRKDAPQVFRLIFRWFALLLLFCVYVFSLGATQALHWFFPASYAAAAPVIPLVAQSLAFYGIYFVLMAGVNIRRKTWLAGVLMGTVAFVNLMLNLVLIPRSGAIGAALSTLIAFTVLAGMAYVVNQVIYPIPFEVGRFLLALLIGVVIYVGSASLAHAWGASWVWPINIACLLAYAVCLIFLAQAFAVFRRQALGLVQLASQWNWRKHRL